MRGDHLRRQWQILQWLELSRRPLNAVEIKNALGLQVHKRTIIRDLNDLAAVFNIERQLPKDQTDDHKPEYKWSLKTEYKYRGLRKEEPKFGMYKTCMKCDRRLDREVDFWRDWKEPDEKNRYCIDCCKQRAKELGRTAYAQKYYQNNKRRILNQRHRRRREDTRFRKVRDEDSDQDDRVDGLRRDQGRTGTDAMARQRV